MARPPLPGRVKTRLAADLGPERAVALYHDLLTGTMSAVEEATELPGVPGSACFLAVAPGEGEEALLGMGSGSWQALRQDGSGLGQRLAGVFARLFARGHGAVIIVASDSPALPSAYVARAARALTAGGEPAPPDLVFGPALDGGYYLVGLRRSAWQAGRRSVEDLLRSAPLGTGRALSFSLARAMAAGVRTELLPLWLDVDRAGDLALAARLTGQADQPARGGRHPVLQEVYLHVTDRCSVGCPHCYAPGPASAAGELSTADWLKIIDRARGLGASSFVFIGGDPFLRPDLLELLEASAQGPEARVRLFFNRPISPSLAAQLAASGRGRLTPLLSLDGPEAVNDSLRGQGNFESGLRSARALMAAGLRPVVNTVLLRPVLPALPALLRTLAAVGLDRLHLILPHERGGLAVRPDLVPSGREMDEALTAALPVAADLGILIDNLAGWKARSSARHDLCSAGCSLLTVGPGGSVYGCPITSGDPAFRLGDLREEDLADVWRGSPGLRLLRHLHARDRSSCASCDVVDACGGECWVQAYDRCRARGDAADLRADFPYCDLVRPRLQAMASESRPTLGTRARDTDLSPFSCI